MNYPQVRTKPRLATRVRKRLQGWLSLEGSLSLMLPPGFELQSQAGSDLLQALVEAERR